MIGTYAAALAVCAASLAVGQAALALCGARRWSWLAPAVGLGLLGAGCWAAVRLPGGGATAAAVVLLAAAGATAFLRGRLDGGWKATRRGWLVGAIALAAASLPFLAEGHFGILGTSFNPDMSQHLLASARLADGVESGLAAQGYPLGPHAIAVALHDGLGVGLVEAFGGLTVAVPVLASLTALAAFAELAPARRATAALLVGLPYLVASYLAQGSFKETMQALFVLAFVLALREATRGGGIPRPLRLLPAALIAVGSVYVYSFPGLLWLGAALLVWLALERPREVRPLLLGGLMLAVLAGPELGRMFDFHRFETFDPAGPGLGNLFGQISPLEALGIWPSGDFRLAPGDGAAPAAAYYLGAAFAAALLANGIAAAWRRGERAVLAGLIAVAAAYVAARAGGTPYTAAKAIEIAAPVVALAIVMPLAGAQPGRAASPERGGWLPPRLAAPLLTAFALAAGGCSLLALVNAPVGPATYDTGLADLRPLTNPRPTVALATRELLEERHGSSYLAWELRGGRVCIEPLDAAGARPPRGVAFVVAPVDRERPPYAGVRLRRVAGRWALWEAARTPTGPSDCPLVEVRQARRGAKG